MIDPHTPDWLTALIDEVAAGHDPAAVRDRIGLPPPDPGAVGAPVDLEPAVLRLVARSLRPHRLEGEERSPDAAFLETARGHVALALDLAVLGPRASSPERTVELATASLAAALGGTKLALDLELSRGGPVPARLLQRVQRAAGRDLLTRFHPPGDPAGGLALYPGQLAVLRRHLARVTMGFHRHGALREDGLERHLAFAERELLFLAEALAGCAADAAPPDDAQRALRLRQVARLGLRRPAWREARAAVSQPRPPDQLADAVPERIRPFLLEQLHLARLLTPSPSPAHARWIEAFVLASGLPPEADAAAQVEAAARHGDQHAWFEALASSQLPSEWSTLAEAWDGAGDQMVERVSTAVTENFVAVMTELRQTGELGQLLAKAAAGRKLTAEEKGKVRAQLIDLAKAVPALAIFAAPGGLLLLPLLAKLLPFNMLPSAWEKNGKEKGGKGGGAPPTATSGE